MAAVLIREACSAAFYCQRCGKVHVHDIPYFTANRTVLRCDRCGQTQVVCERNAGGRQIVFTVGCVLCGNESRAVYSLKSLPQIRLEKIFCQYDHFELGYIGRRRLIAELLAFNQAEFEALHPQDGKNFIEKQPILLEALNRVHEMATQGDIICPCGSGLISADIRGNSIVLSCDTCGSYYVLRAETERDLARIGRGMDIGLITPGMARKR